MIFCALEGAELLHFLINAQTPVQICLFNFSCSFLFLRSVYSCIFYVHSSWNTYVIQHRYCDLVVGKIICQLHSNSCSSSNDLSPTSFNHLRSADGFLGFLWIRFFDPQSPLRPAPRSDPHACIHMPHGRLESKQLRSST